SSLWLKRSITIVFELNFSFACPKEKLQKKRTPRGGVGRSRLGGLGYPQPSVPAKETSVFLLPAEPPSMAAP
ncbi:MAG: hypothetical protein IJG80_07620, partial [Selenomonadaceae bacterium]|nr:hypothetical protein [Selenomonadaceae bacterium]